MPSLEDLVRKYAERLAGLNVDSSGLTDAIRDGVRVARVRNAVADRIDELGKAQAELTLLHEQVEHVRRILKFTQEGWPERRAELAAAFEASPATGMAAWLDDWLVAASQGRFDALARLTDDIELPDAMGVLRSRARLEAHALQTLDSSLPVPLLEAGAAGSHVGGAKGPARKTQTGLRLILARLALNGQPQELDLSDARLEDVRRSVSAVALRSATAQLRGDRELADDLLSRAREQDTTNLDVAYELVLDARGMYGPGIQSPDGSGSVASPDDLTSDGSAVQTTGGGLPVPLLDDDLDAAIEAAQVAVDALPSLLDIDNDLAVLLTPPAELWVAAARRAMREGEPDLADYALLRAEGRTRPDDFQLLALIYELRDENSSDEQVKLTALAAAGDLRMAANQFDRARRDFDRARRLPAEGDAVAQQRIVDRLWAECVWTQTTGKPLHTVRKELTEALGVLHAAQAGVDLAGTESWAYVVEHRLHQELSREIGPAARQQLWEGLLAACRAVALEPASAQRWATLAEAAEGLRGRYFTVAAGRRGVELPAHRNYTLPRYANALSTIGRFDDEVYDGYGEGSDNWTECLRGRVLLYAGRPADAVLRMQTAVFDPACWWAAGTYVDALILTGRLDSAIAQSAVLNEGLGLRAEEYDGLWLAAYLAEVRGEFEQAASWAGVLAEFDRPKGSGTACNLLAEVRLLLGEPGALELLGRDLALTKTEAGLMDWGVVQRPRLEALARHYQVELPSLDGLDEIVAARLAEVTGQTDPVENLRAINTDDIDAGVVDQVRRLGAVLARVAEGEDDAATELLAAVDPESAEHRSLAAYLAESPTARLGRVVEAAARDGDRAATATALRQLLDEPDQAAVAESAAGIAREPMVGELLTELSQEEPYRDLALRALGAPAKESHSVEIALPVALFETDDDQRQPHLEALDVALTALARLNGVDLTAAFGELADAASTDFLVWVDGELSLAGELDLGKRYAPAVDLLPDSLSGQATASEGPQSFDVPAEVVPAAGPLAGLLTWSAPEAVAQLVIEELVERGRLAFDAAGEQAADEVALQAEEDDQRHDHGDERAG
ncbi:hypothetical protein [Flindersiella endophytica]